MLLPLQLVAFLLLLTPLSFATLHPRQLSTLANPKATLTQSLKSKSSLDAPPSATTLGQTTTLISTGLLTAPVGFETTVVMVTETESSEGMAAATGAAGPRGGSATTTETTEGSTTATAATSLETLDSAAGRERVGWMIGIVGVVGVML